MNILKKLLQKRSSLSQVDFLPYLSILIIVFLAIFITNFPFHSWYTGWDNLHPEFNFWLNFKRGLTSVWQSNQGLGTYGGHGYAATLFHTVSLFLMSLLLPQQYLRSGFTFLTLILGAIGTFFLARKLLSHLDKDVGNKAALLAGLFYMLNLATVENFYIQLEAFIVHFAALPWLFLSLINLLQNFNKKNLLIFISISILSSIQGFIPPLFVVYILLLGIFLFIYTIQKFTFQKLRNSFVILIITFIINAYWFMPVAYYSLTRSSIYLNSYNNLSSTQDFIFKNQKYGNIKDVILLKGFILESIDSAQNGQIFYIFNQWQKHLNNSVTSTVGYLLFGIIMLGCVNLYRKKDDPYGKAVIVGLIVIFGLLATNTFPFSMITKVLQDAPVFKQAFRIAFTKFSISLSFLYALSFGSGSALLFSFFRQRKKLNNIFLVIVIALLIQFSYPNFTGNFLYYRTKLNFPAVYSELFNFFAKQPENERIANFPQGWHWGWSNYDWGYSGSGFLWYGIQQPILDRAFDVWSNYNENYYWEISYAVYSENFPLVTKIFNKYQVHWIIFDKNIIPYPNVKSFIYSDQLEQYFDSSSDFKLVKTLSPNEQHVKEIKIYEVLSNKKNSSNQEILTNLKNVLPIYRFSNYDQAYNSVGDYVSDTSAPPDYNYAFRTLFTGRTPNELTAILPNNSQNQYVYDSNNDPDFLQHSATNCSSLLYPNGSYKQEKITGNILRFTSKNSENCYSIVLDSTSQRLSYMIKVESRNIQGQPLQFALINHESKKTDIELTLNDKSQFNISYIVIPPMKYYGLGYTLNFNNVSVGDNQTINDIKRISLYSIPYDSLINSAEIHPNNVEVQNTTLVYYQSFDPGWKAWINGQELKSHILVNNWANGWKLSSNLPPQTSNIVIVFWPQYLEFAGFGLLILTLIFILKYHKI